jgi:hypothetical protein
MDDYEWIMNGLWMDYYGLLHVITVDDDTDADELAEAGDLWWFSSASDLFPGTGPKRRRSVPQGGPRGILS